jgi:hypothetical protein
MQTFLPYSSFTKSASVLDNLRLGKQRVEVLQILHSLILNKGWIHHPAVRMWKGYEKSLSEYGIAICKEWISRGFKDNCLVQLQTINQLLGGYIIFDEVNKICRTEKPKWFGNEQFHSSHKSNLLRKFPEWYDKYGWTESNDLPYYWPTKDNK